MYPDVTFVHLEDHCEPTPKGSTTSLKGCTSHTSNLLGSEIESSPSCPRNPGHPCPRHRGRSPITSTPKVPPKPQLVESSPSCPKNPGHPCPRNLGLSTPEVPPKPQVIESSPSCPRNPGHPCPRNAGLSPKTSTPRVPPKPQIIESPPSCPRNPGHPCPSNRGLSPTTSTPRLPPKPQAVPRIAMTNPEPGNSTNCGNLQCRGSKNAVDTSNSIGHISHIPRTPPCPGTYSVPSINNLSCTKSVEITYPEDGLFGMIALKDNDVCYTSGTIEWVGRKRNYPINSGFKCLKEPSNGKRMRKLDHSVTIETDTPENNRSCECADVLPTVNAIIDHLNALHEAVDLVDLRLNNLEKFH